MKLRGRIPVEPLSDAQWERIERRVLERERELPGPAATPQRGRRWPVLAGAGLGLMLAAAAVVLWVALRPAPRAVQPALTRVVTPAGGAPTRVVIGDAEIDVAPGSEANLRVTPTGDITVELAHGRVDCDVAHRPGRPRFDVVAGDVDVVVVGTRFAVARADAGEVMVEVTRGKVRVESPRGSLAVAAGERVTIGAMGMIAGRADIAGAGGEPGTNPSTSTSTSTNPSTNPSTSTTDDGGSGPVASAEPRPRKPEPRKLALADAVVLRQTKPDDAGRRLRQLSLGSDAVAASALYELAHLSLFRLRAPYAALAAAREYQRRFPTGPDAADALWIRIEAHLDANDHAAAREAAASYLERFPGGAKATRAQTVRDLE